MEDGSKYLCARCYHLQTAGPLPERTLGSTAFLSVAIACLAALALAGLALCVLYLLGTGNLPWFVLLGLLTFCVVGCPAALLLLFKRRNITLLVASLYLPLGLWSFLWHLAPGVEWEYSRTTAWGALFFLFLGAVAMCLFLRDLRALPRL